MVDQLGENIHVKKPSHAAGSAMVDPLRCSCWYRGTELTIRSMEMFVASVAADDAACFV